MQAAKVKVKDMVSTAKERVREHKAKSEEKSEAKAALTHTEKELAHEKCKAKIAEAKAQKYKEKAEHRLPAQVHARGNHMHVGAGPTPVVTTVPKYPASSAYPDGSDTTLPKTGTKYA